MCWCLLRAVLVLELLAEPMLMFVLGQGTVPPAADGSPSGSTGVALYAVVAVIVVFVVAIITLSIIIVFLYRRKCGHQELPSASDHGSIPRTGDSLTRYGLQNSELKRHESVTNSITKQSLGSESLSLSRTPKEVENSPPPYPPKDAACGSPPPRPPKSGRRGSKQQTEEVVLVDPETPGEGKRHKQKIKFKVLESGCGGNYERSPGYQCSSPVVVVSTSSDPHDTRFPLDTGETPASTMDTGQLFSSMESKYCGDYERSPDYLVSGGALLRSNTDTAPVPSKYRGNYERDPDYQYSGGALRRCYTDGMQSKYRGDYERDPNYMRWKLARQEASTFDPTTFDPTCPHRIPPPQEVLEGRGRGQVEEGRGNGRTDKYRGDYDRCETYSFPPSLQRQSHDQLESKSCDPESRSHDPPVRMRIEDKYRGNYERDPLYMEKLGHLVPATHAYTTLETTTRLPVQPYSSTITCHSSSPSKDGSISPEPRQHHSPVHSGMLSADV